MVEKVLTRMLLTRRCRELQIVGSHVQLDREQGIVAVFCAAGC